MLSCAPDVQLVVLRHVVESKTAEYVDVASDIKFVCAKVDTEGAGPVLSTSYTNPTVPFVPFALLSTVFVVLCLNLRVGQLRRWNRGIAIIADQAH